MDKEDRVAHPLVDKRYHDSIDLDLLRHGGGRERRAGHDKDADTGTCQKG